MTASNRSFSDGFKNMNVFFILICALGMVVLFVPQIFINDNPDLIKLTVTVSIPLVYFVYRLFKNLVWRIWGMEIIKINEDEIIIRYIYRYLFTEKIIYLDLKEIQSIRVEEGISSANYFVQIFYSNSLFNREYGRLILITKSNKKYRVGQDMSKIELLNTFKGILNE